MMACSASGADDVLMCDRGPWFGVSGLVLVEGVLGLASAPVGVLSFGVWCTTRRKMKLESK